MLTVSALPVTVIRAVPETLEALSGRNAAVYWVADARVGSWAPVAGDVPHALHKMARSANVAHLASLVNRASTGMKDRFIVYSLCAGRTGAAHCTEVMGA